MEVEVGIEEDLLMIARCTVGKERRKRRRGNMKKLGGKEVIKRWKEGKDERSE